jgi:phosphoribosylformylglycinamidine cyclo-ligase
MTGTDRGAYAAAGVDVAAGERAVELMRAAVGSTRRPEVVGDLGGFAAAMGLPPGSRDPLLVSATDGVGTKTALAAALGRYDTIGRDLVAMCADDVACTGAAPLFFLDYVAVGRVVPERVAALVEGIAAGCREAGCALVGGETAEHPGLMGDDDFDLAGFCVGVVERGRVLDGTAARAGDAIVGLASSGLHANGYSLVRSIVASRGLDLAAPFERIMGESVGESLGTSALAPAPGASDDGQSGGWAATAPGATLGDVLLEPTRIYAVTLLALRDALDGAGRRLAGLAHVTGGGLPGNVPRALPDGLGARLDPSRWPMPDVMRLLGALGGLGGAELRATFNGGLGMIAVVEPAAVPTTLESLAASGIAAGQVGEVVPVESLGGRRYAEGSLGS